MSNIYPPSSTQEQRSNDLNSWNISKIIFYIFISDIFFRTSIVSQTHWHHCQKPPTFIDIFYIALNNPSDSLTQLHVKNNNRFISFFCLLAIFVNEHENVKIAFFFQASGFSHVHFVTYKALTMLSETKLPFIWKSLQIEQHFLLKCIQNYP